MVYKKAIITGASSGIGRSCAKQLAKEGVDLILVARRLSKLEALKKEINSEHNVRVTLVEGDVRHPAELTAKLSAISKELETADILINNAGLARGTDKLQAGKQEDWDEMLDTNVKGLLHLTRAVLPYFLKNQRGHIINMGSVAGLWVYPGGAVYCATKYAVRAISEGLRMDLFGTPIRVTNIEPGMVATEFSKVRFGDDQKAKDVYKGMTPLSAEDIAECVVWSLARPAHVNIQEMVIFPTDQAAITQVFRR